MAILSNLRSNEYRENVYITVVYDDDHFIFYNLSSRKTKKNNRPFNYYYYDSNLVQGLKPKKNDYACHGKQFVCMCVCM